jgi:hypothetical protein
MQHNFGVKQGPGGARFILFELNPEGVEVVVKIFEGERPKWLAAIADGNLLNYIALNGSFY